MIAEPVELRNFGMTVLPTLTIFTATDWYHPCAVFAVSL
jgi:hypothetical protein